MFAFSGIIELSFGVFFMSAIRKSRSFAEVANEPDASFWKLEELPLVESRLGCWVFDKGSNNGRDVSCVALNERADPSTRKECEELVAASGSHVGA